MQLACAFCLIAHDGCSVQPRIIVTDPIVIGHRLYKQKSIDLIKHILEETTVRGTAQRAQIKGYKIMSKTGTANTLKNGIYTPEENIFSCTGIVQKYDYQRVVAVCVKAPGKKDLYAATVAAPLFEQVVERMLVHDHIVGSG